MTKDEIYDELWAIFKPLEAGLDPERQVALGSCIDAAARKLAASWEVEIEAARKNAIENSGAYRV